MTKAMLGGGFFTEGEDERLEEDNAAFWDALIEHIVGDEPDVSVRAVLDIGCHRGGLLERMRRRWTPEALYGLEPLRPIRDQAAARLAEQAPRVEVLPPDASGQIPERRIDLVTGHEVLYLIEDVNGLMARVSRWLRPGGGRAYFVLGCHPENPMWGLWKPRLEAMGHQVFDHLPVDILSAGAHAGLVPALRPLREGGWVKYNPLASEFPFPSAGALLEHHFRYKLLFRFVRP